MISCCKKEIILIDVQTLNVAQTCWSWPALQRSD